MTNTKGKSFWMRETLSGKMEHRSSSIVLFTILPVLLAGLFYKLLIAIEGLDRGPEIIVVLTLGISVLLAMLILLVIIISLIDHLRAFE